MKRIFSAFALFLVFAALAGCTKKKGELGSPDNPIKFIFVPSIDTRMLTERVAVVKRFLEAKTPYKYEMIVPASFIAVVEAFGTERADIASINTFGYILASEKYPVEAKLKVIRFGSDTYQSQIVVRADSGIKSIKDLAGKKFAFVDPASTSGYLMPAKLFMDNGIKPKETVFAQKHDNVITMVYQRQVDAGATFYTPPQDGVMQDARRLVKTQFPDVEQKVKILQLTDPIPNDPIVMRKNLPEELKEKVTQAMIDFMTTEEGKSTFVDIFSSNGIKRATDKDYDSVRAMLKSLGKNAGELMKK